MKVHGYVNFFLPVCANSTLQDLEKNTCSRNPKTVKTHREPKELSTDISALCPLKDLREVYLRPCRTNIDLLLSR